MNQDSTAALSLGLRKPTPEQEFEIISNLREITVVIMKISNSIQEIDLIVNEGLQLNTGISASYDQHQTIGDATNNAVVAFVVILDHKIGILHVSHENKMFVVSHIIDVAFSYLTPLQELAHVNFEEASLST